MSLLEVQNIGKSFGGLTAVKNLSFQVEWGVTLGIIGPNGAGKTTLFNLITGMLPVDAGRIFFAGNAITRAPAHVRCRLGLARTFQVVQPFENLSVLENVLVGVLHGGKPPAARARSQESRAAAKVALPDAEQRARELCDLVGLSGQQHRRPGELTTAGLKRMEIARALGTSPQLLILDEPMEGLTPVELREAVALVRRIRASGVSIVIIEHVMPAIKDICDHVLVMHHGEMLTEGPFEQVAVDARVIEAYLGEDAEEECRP